MPKTSTTLVPLQNWCAKELQYRSPREAILAIDLRVQGSDDAEQVLNAAWTAIVLWLKADGMVDPAWYSLIARFHRLSTTELNRVREAIEMRLRAFERIAA